MRSTGGQPLGEDAAPSRCGSGTSSSSPIASRLWPGRRFGVGVATDADVYRWLFDGRRGKYRKHVLVLRAPDEPGTYVLYAIVGRWADRAEVVVAQPEQP